MKKLSLVLSIIIILTSCNNNEKKEIIQKKLTRLELAGKIVSDPVFKGDVKIIFYVDTDSKQIDSLYKSLVSFEHIRDYYFKLLKKELKNDSLNDVAEQKQEQEKEDLCIKRGHFFEYIGGTAFDEVSDDYIDDLIDAKDSSYIVNVVYNRFCYRCNAKIQIRTYPKYIKTIWKRKTK